MDSILKEILSMGKKSNLKGVDIKKNGGGFFFEFMREKPSWGKFFGNLKMILRKPYDFKRKRVSRRIVKKLKTSILFGIDYVTYSCSESTYKGKIGFVVSEGVGLIRHFPNPN
ncbi:MAG: hypothetical protein CM15mP83_8190 [Flavobacteriaceae bacterium]|nr:MAG: hypothetical protein CM15mP83_8190 [Flavobacteriaceae bacterium]